MNPEGACRYKREQTYQRKNMTDSEQVNPEYYEQRNSASATNTQEQPTHADGYTRIPPNVSRRNELQRIAQTEEENLRIWKEENRPGPIQLPPEILGGALSLAEVRRKQQQDTYHAKSRKRLQKEEMDRKRRQVEEEENQKMKAKQREEAIKLEVKRKQEERHRQDLYQHDHQMKNREFLQEIEASSKTVSMAATNPIPASSWAKCHEHRESRRQEENAALLMKKEEQRRKAELLEEKQKQQEEDRKRQIETDRRRVNLAFLNRLEASSSGRVTEPMARAAESSDVCLEDDKPQEPVPSPVPEPLVPHSEDSEMEDSDHMWAVMKLQHTFPYYERDMLEDIVKQCNGDYNQAFELLNV